MGWLSDKWEGVKSFVEDPKGSVETMWEDVTDDPLKNVMGTHMWSALPEALGGEHTEDYWKGMGLAGAGALGFSALGGGGAGAAGGGGGGGLGGIFGGGGGGGMTLGQMMGIGVVGGLGQGWLQSQAQKEAYEDNIKMQQQQWNEYLQTLKPEWRFTPEQLSLQEAMIPQYQAQMAYATGLKDDFYTPPEEGAEAYTKSFEQEMAKQQQLGEAQRTGFERLAGESLGQIGQSQLQQLHQAQNLGRSRYGEALGGATAADRLGIEDRMAGEELKAKMYPGQAMMQYKQGLLGQASQGLKEYMNLPLGNLPTSGPPQPLYQQANTMWSDFIGDLSSTMLLYNMMNPGQRQETNINTNGSFNAPSSLYPSQNFTDVPWTATPASIKNPFVY